MPSKEKRGRRRDEPLVQRVFQRRGTVEILILLSEEKELRFSEVGQRLPNIAPQLVGTRLADLRELGMVERTAETGPPVSSTYALTELGHKLSKVARDLKAVASSPKLPESVR